MDVWEASSIYAATAHLSTLGQTMREADDCGGTYSSDRYAGVCDPDGCDFNPYRLGSTTFYDPGSNFAVNTESTFTVVTQFKTDSSGILSSINRIFVQNGNVIALIAQASSDVPGVIGNSITQSFCEVQKTAFGDTEVFDQDGGLSGMSSALAEGMVLVLSLWEDDYASMLWLDSDYPTNETASTPGGAPRVLLYLVRSTIYHSYTRCKFICHIFEHQVRPNQLNIHSTMSTSGFLQGFAKQHI